MSDVEDLKGFLDQHSETVQRNVKVVTPEDLEQDFFLHISMDTAIKEFVPFIGRRQAPSEDRTVPRVCVAPNLLGCFIGYASAEHDVMSFKGDKNSSWKGGWCIYALPFQAALKPGAKMVYDAERSGEHWLVAYNKETAVYKPEAAGKAFYRVIQFIPKSGKSPDSEGILYVEVTKEEGIRFSANHYLKKGYWTITGPTPEHASLTDSDRSYVVKEISKADYQSAKNAAADLLSLTEKMPAYLKW